MKNSITAAALVFMCAGPALSQMSKCTASNGKITYSDAPCDTASKKIESLNITASTGYWPAPVLQPRQEGVQEPSLPAPAYQQPDAPAAFVPNQYQCETARRNYEVSVKLATKKSQAPASDREMNLACYGVEHAAQIEQARAAAPRITIKNSAAPTITHCDGAYCYDSRGRAIFVPNRLP